MKRYLSDLTYIIGRQNRIKNNRSLYRLLIKALLSQPKSQKLMILAVGIGALGVSLAPRTLAVQAREAKRVELTNAAPVIETTPLIFNQPVKKAIVTQGFRLWHKAIDLAAPRGEPVFPIDGGTVTKVSNNHWGLGKSVEVKHRSNLLSKYGHLDKILVKEGTIVTTETPLGTVGRTGFATGPHLHLEVWEEGSAINPMDYLRYQ
jgi:murein DD-endopeptidase MepM/ murein hydrolase activator NlpD